MPSALATEPNPLFCASQSVQFIPLKEHPYGHKSERLLRRILKYYGFGADYEPHEIRISETAVTPDFLVDDFYIELTTAKGGTRTEKNRKLKLAAANGVPLYIMSNSSFKKLIEQYLVDRKIGNTNIDLFSFLRRPGEDYRPHLPPSSQFTLQPAYA